jgi:hypothetical protein
MNYKLKQLKEGNKKGDFYSGVVIRPGSKGASWAAVPGAPLLPVRIYQPGVKVSLYSWLADLYSRKFSPGWATGSKGVANREKMSFLY